MGKEEFLKVKNEMNKDIAKITKDIEELEKEYILCNREFEDREKVKIVSDKGVDFAFISSCKIHNDGELYYGLRKVLKNGEMSNQRFVRHNLDWFKILKISDKNES